jgi:hypothetical protein
MKANKKEILTPVNTKSMFSLLCMYMEKLHKKEITIQEAQAMAKLVGQANNLLEYELKRAAFMSNPEIMANHRNLEMKYFDALPEKNN